MPRTVDELRVKTNPKLTYEGRVREGINQKEQLCQMYKNTNLKQHLN